MIAHLAFPVMMSYNLPVTEKTAVLQEKKNETFFNMVKGSNPDE